MTENLPRYASGYPPNIPPTSTIRTASPAIRLERDLSPLRAPFPVNLPRESPPNARISGFLNVGGNASDCQNTQFNAGKMTLKRWVRSQIDPPGTNRPGDRAKEVPLWPAHKFWVIRAYFSKICHYCGYFPRVRSWIRADVDEYGILRISCPEGFFCSGDWPAGAESLVGSAIGRPV